MNAPRIGFQARLLIGAILPALLMVAVLETVFLDRYRADIEHSFLERGKAIARQLGVAAEYALFAGSYGSLDMLAAGVRQSDGDIVSVSVLGADGRRLAGSGPQPRHALLLKDELQVLGDARQVTIQAPIRKTVVPLEGEIWDAGPVAAPAGVNGYVLVEISRGQIEARKREMLRITLAIVLAGLLLAGWISASIAGDVLRRLEAARRELAGQKEAAEALARTDALTGLANRRAFDEAAQREIRRALRYGTPLALVITDIDHFKAINDAHGHACGDQVLVDFARTLLVSVRDVDLVGRWGGEEFVILMPGTDLDEAVAAAERMRLAVAGVPTRFEGRTCGYTASFGVTALRMDETNLDALLGRADAALYRAKDAGRNRVVVG
jgi:diguanylate cyclase (GGDEF)-like protein